MSYHIVYYNKYNQTIADARKSLCGKSVVANHIDVDIDTTTAFCKACARSLEKFSRSPYSPNVLIFQWESKRLYGDADGSFFKLVEKLTLTTHNLYMNIFQVLSTYTVYCEHGPDLSNDIKPVNIYDLIQLIRLWETLFINSCNLQDFINCSYINA